MRRKLRYCTACSATVELLAQSDIAFASSAILPNYRNANYYCKEAPGLPALPFNFASVKLKPATKKRKGKEGRWGKAGLTTIYFRSSFGTGFWLSCQRHLSYVMLHR